MRHDHIVITLDPDSKARIRDDLDAGESVEAWVADAVERKLDGKNEDGLDGNEDGSEPEAEANAEDERGGYEFVDDCAV